MGQNTIAVSHLNVLPLPYITLTLTLILTLVKKLTVTLVNKWAVYVISLRSITRNSRYFGYHNPSVDDIFRHQTLGTDSWICSRLLFSVVDVWLWLALLGFKFIVHSGSGLVSSLEAQAANWAKTPIPNKARHYARSLKDWVGERWTHLCVCVLVIVFNGHG